MSKHYKTEKDHGSIRPSSTDATTWIAPTDARRGPRTVANGNATTTWNATTTDGNVARNVGNVTRYARNVADGYTARHATARHDGHAKLGERLDGKPAIP